MCGSDNFIGKAGARERCVSDLELGEELEEVLEVLLAGLLVSLEGEEEEDMVRLMESIAGVSLEKSGKDGRGTLSCVFVDRRFGRED